MKERNSSIDFLKGLAILAVLLVHTAQKYHLPSSVKYVCSFGQYGCQMFFVISGYLAYKSLKDSSWAFYKRRLLSIVPGYWLTIALFLVITFAWASLGLSPQYAQCRSFSGITANALLWHGFLPFCINKVVPGGWYIGTLVVLYALTPSLKQCLKIVNRPIAFGVFFAMLILLDIVFQYCVSRINGMSELSGNNHFLYFFFLNQLPCYVIGLYIAKSEDCTAGERRGGIHPSLYLFFGLLLLVLAFDLTLFTWELSPMLLPALVGVASGLILAAFSQNPLDFARKQGICSMFFHSITVYGQFSYSAYLIHTLFAYYFAYIVNKCCARFGISHDLLLFIPVLIIVIFLTFFTAKIYGKIIQLITAFFENYMTSHSRRIDLWK